ncbi:glycosyltransferase family A protein [Actinoplanes sp. CA-142083]|uniref:glycosyltransferase family A protein n=1 Tax=Actinoplanes sp. CA-142083 TaxID=3239903 RepID=UPI003D90DD01
MKADRMVAAPVIAPNGGELPAVVLDLDLADPLPSVAGVHTDGRRVLRAWVLVRLFEEPLGTMLIDLPAKGLRPAGLGSAIQAELGDRLGGLPVPLDGYTPATEPAFLARRRAVLETAPHITVVVCTRERPGALARCLDSLLAQRYPAFRVLVVDSAPITGATAEVTRAAARRGPVEYLVENRNGMAFARNAAVLAAPGQILAWIDDNDVADPHWLAEIARALDEHPDAAVIAGAVAPAELECPAQLWFEQLTASPGDVSFPYDGYAGLTFRPGVIERAGMFDTALPAADDLLIVNRVLAGGGGVVRQASAVTWRYHPSDRDGVRRRVVARRRGLAAAYTKMALEKPTLAWKLVRAARWGMLSGPRTYLRGKRAARAQEGWHDRAGLRRLLP